MRILSLNAWGGRLHAPLLAYLADDPPDILCLQEITHTPQSDKDWLDYRDGALVLPQVANLLRDIRRVLPRHMVSFCPAAQGDLWDGDTLVPSQFGLATFVAETVPVIAQAQRFVHKDYSPSGYGSHPRARNAHAIRVHDAAAGRNVAITHMHGLRDPASGKRDTPERAAQAERLLALSQSVTGPGDLAIVCGDFNVEPESETLRSLGEAGFTELVTSRGFTGTRTSHYEKAGRFADYMLVSETAPVRAFSVVSDPEVSDHCPLLLEI